MKQKYIVSIGYTKLAFDDKESAMRAYMLLTDSVPVTGVYCYAPNKAPDSLKDVSYVREKDLEIELKRVDAGQFALHLTEDEYREKCKPQPTEVDGEMRVVEEVKPAPALEGPADAADVIEDDFPL
jgi:hypothetical protein